jgi:hypothetical protein
LLARTRDRADHLVGLLADYDYSFLRYYGEEGHAFSGMAADTISFLRLWGCLGRRRSIEGFWNSRPPRVLPVKIGAGQKSKLWPRAGPSLRWVTGDHDQATRRQSREGLQ